MARKNRNARELIPPRKIKTRPNVWIECRQIRYRPEDDFRPGVIVAEAQVRRVQNV